MTGQKPTTVEDLAETAASYADSADDLVANGCLEDARTCALVSVAYSQAALALAARPTSTVKGES